MPSEMPRPSSLLPWSSEFELGVPEIDAQHRRLFDYVNGFAHALSHGRGAVEAIGILLQEAVAHFDFEEALMRSVGYQAAALHAEQHAELLASMDRMRARLVHESYPADQRKSLDFLHDWFSIHIIRSDADLARHLKAGALA